MQTQTKDTPTMTGNPNFVSDLVAMAKAFEELPKVQAELSEINNQLIATLDTVAAREKHIIELKAMLDELSNAKRSVEAERDDAELRFLLADERTGKALEFIKTTFGSAGSVIQSLEPPAKVADIPMPPAEPEVRYQDGKVGASEGDLASTHSDMKTLGEEVAYSYPTDATMGQSEPLPTSPEPSNIAAPVVASGIGTQLTKEAPAAPTVDPTVVAESNETGPSVTSSGADSTANASQPITTNSSGPYTGKRYYDEPVYISLVAWLDGGGTEADYLAPCFV